MCKETINNKSYRAGSEYRHPSFSRMLPAHNPLVENRLFHGDAKEILESFPDKLFDMCVTSPPYWGLRDYGIDGQLGLEPTPEEYVEKIVAIFHQVRRVLRDDGTLWLNLGDSYASGGTGGCSFKSTLNSGKGVSNNAKLRKMEQLSRPSPPGLKPKDIVGIPWMVAFALRSDGWYLRQDIIWHKPNPMPESVADRCTKSHEYIFLLSKSKKYYYDQESIKEYCVYNDPRMHNDFEPSRLFRGYPGAASRGGGPLNKARSHKGSRFDRGKTATHQLGRAQKGVRVHGNLPGRDDDGRACNKRGQEMRNKRSVWSISTKPFKEAHFATFPPDLIIPCIKAGSRKNGIVLDPFFGSGTTGEVANRLGRYYTGIDLNKEYIEKIAGPRLSQQNLFMTKTYTSHGQEIEQTVNPKREGVKE